MVKSKYNNGENEFLKIYFYLHIHKILVIKEPNIIKKEKMDFFQMIIHIK
jgi:hypothetical protein